jgi:hypothetical protein
MAMAMETVAPTTPRMAPLFTAGGEYYLYPLHVCSAEAVAELFVKICARGNPILQGKPSADLHRLGIAFYKKSVGSVASLVFLKGDEPVALMFSWDSFHGGVWKGASGPPESLLCHAAIGMAIFASKPCEVTLPGQEMFMAFGGVALPHPGPILLHSMQIMAILSASAAGYINSFGYSVHPKTIEQSQSIPAEPGVRQVWSVTYSDIEVADVTIHEEMCNIHPGTAECSVTSIASSVSKVHQMAPSLAEDFRPGVARMLAYSHVQFDDGVQMPMASL